jgi:8-oxo-dGTP pyrophosphatase MutT (NUDIX family)
MLHHLSPASTRDSNHHQRRAGGVVLTMVEDRLCVAAVRPARHPDGAWCLPKGKVEDDESPLGAALREVREETGLICEALEALGELTFDVARDGMTVTKRTTYWLMAPIGGAPPAPVPGASDEIVAAGWRPIDGPEPALTHPDEARFLAGVIMRLQTEAGEY